MAKEKIQELALSVKKKEDISKWYTEVILKADLIEYTDVAGCMIFKPNSYQIWEKIQAFLDDRIKIYHYGLKRYQKARKAAS